MEDTGGYRVRPYRRSWWLPGSHLQTIAGWLLRPRGGVALQRERLETPDGDFLDLDFVVDLPASNGAHRRPPADAPLVLVLHGLEGGSHSLPALQAIRSVYGQGLRAAVLNFRSCGGEMNRTARFYHAGDTDDLALVISTLAGRFPDAPLGILGYSLGGNVLLKYLGERSAAATGRIRAAAAVSVPFDLAAGARKLERGLGPVYARHFLRSLRRKYRAKAALLNGHCDPRRVDRCRTLWEFDDVATAPLHGFRSAEHYYATSSSVGFLERIRVPTLLLHAADDPFLPAASIPREAVRRNPSLTAEFTHSGGHMGFLAGRRPWAIEYWAEAEAARFLAHHLLPHDADTAEVAERAARQPAAPALNAGWPSRPHAPDPHS